jgi:hypothetical protein
MTFFSIIFSSMILGLIPHQHQLHPESPSGAVITGHGEEDAVGNFRVGTLREADGRIAVAKSGFEGCAELSGIEEASHVGFSQMRVRHLVGISRRSHSTEREQGLGSLGYKGLILRERREKRAA